jgi:hypothetical protein
MQRRNFRFLGLALIGAMTLGAAACGDEVVIPPPPATLTVTPAALNLQINQTAQIVPQATGVTNPQYTFNSTAPTVAEVNAQGVVTARAAGSATITVGVQGQPGLNAAVQVTVQPAPVGPTPVISISPASPTIAAGQTVTLVAVRQNTARGVTWSIPAGEGQVVQVVSQDTASITLRGLAAGGSATVIATSLQNPGVTAAATVTVTAAPTPAISVASITQPGPTAGTTVPVDPENVRGLVDVTFNVTPGDADRLRVRLQRPDGTLTTEIPACDRGLAGLAPAQSVTITCTINTAAFDVTATGGVATAATARFPNAGYRIHAELLRGTESAQAVTSEVLTFRNIDRVLANVRPTATAFDAEGYIWTGGDITLDVLPLIYSPATAGGQIANVVVTMDGYRAGQNVTVTQTATGTAPAYQVTFANAAGANNIAAFNTGWIGSRVSIRTVTAGGQPGPFTNQFAIQDLQAGTGVNWWNVTEWNSILRVDNEAPEAGRLFLGPHPVGAPWMRNGWVNDEYNFRSWKDGQHDAPFDTVAVAAVGPRGTRASTHFPTMDPAPANALRGVGLPAAAADAFQIFALRNPGTATDAAVVANGVQITTGAQLQQTVTNEEYAVVARVRDRLGNTSFVRLSRHDFPATAEGMGSQTGIATRIGVDFSQPVVQITSAIQNRYNPMETFTVQSRDGVDGYSGLALTRIDRNTWACTTAECQPAPMTATAGVATRIHPIGITIDALSYETANITVQAYHQLAGLIWDRAGNRSVTPGNSIEFIVDRPMTGVMAAPIVSNVRQATVIAFLGGQAYEYAARVQDNVDIRRVASGYDFGTAGDLIRLPFMADSVTPFGHTHVVRDREFVRNMTFVRSLQTVDAAGVAPTTTATTRRPTWVRFRGWDHSGYPFYVTADTTAAAGLLTLGHFSTAATNIVAETVDQGNTVFGQVTGGRQVNRLEWTTNPGGLTGTFLTVRGQTGTFVNPFARVHFYVRLPADQYADADGEPIYYLVGTVASPNVQDTGADLDGRMYHFRLPALPAGMANLPRFAVGVTASGDALMSTWQNLP